MFLIPEHEPQYRSYLKRNIEEAYDPQSGKSIQNRSEIVQGSQQSNAEAVMENPSDELVYSEAKESALKFVEFLQAEGDAFSHIMQLENVDQNIAHHGVTVSTLAVALAKRLGLSDKKQLQLLTLGALIHDIEHFYSGVSIARPLKDFSSQELEVYKKHPTLGGQRVQDKKHFDQSVINIIVQHEEYIDGKGWPQGLTESKMDPLAVITASANALDRLICFEEVPQKEATKQLMLTGVGKYPLDHIKILGDIMSKMKI